jgi:sec-independent protein translocase protein TatC
MSSSMAGALRPIGHDHRLTLVEHLGELRTRLIISVVAVAVAFGISFWQNHALLGALNRPLEHAGRAASTHTHGALASSARAQAALRAALQRQSAAFRAVAGSRRGVDPAARRALVAAAAAGEAAARATPRSAPANQPVTLGLGEPFTQTIMVSAYFALLFSLPLILFQLYAFVLPAFSRAQKEVVLPLMGMVPVLFTAGVLFGYFFVLPAAVTFLQNFNSGSFDALVQAKTYYSFVLLTLMAMGVLFQIPVGVIALNRLGIVSAKQLRSNRRYAIVGIAVLAMLLPGTDPVTTLLEMAPMLVLFEFSVLLATFYERRTRRRDAAAALH